MASPRFAAVWAVVRLLLSVAILAAIVGQLIRTTTRAVDLKVDVAMAITNFFSFFTILSNTFAMVAFAVAGVWLLRHARSTQRTPTPLAVTLAAVSTYMIITGLVYNLLLRNIPLPQGATVPWSNEILHVYAPIVILLDVLVAPRVRALKWRALATIIVFPVVWVIYTMIRGPLASNPFGQGGDTPTWYPYPFLEPTQPGGYGTVLLYVLGIAAAIIAIAAGVIAIERFRARRLATHAPDAADAAAPA